jgi:hypothetical protein
MLTPSKPADRSHHRHALKRPALSALFVLVLLWFAFDLGRGLPRYLVPSAPHDLEAYRTRVEIHLRQIDQRQTVQSAVDEVRQAHALAGDGDASGARAALERARGILDGLHESD